MNFEDCFNWSSIRCNVRILWHLSNDQFWTEVPFQLMPEKMRIALKLLWVLVERAPVSMPYDHVITKGDHVIMKGDHVVRRGDHVAAKDVHVYTKGDHAAMWDNHVTMVGDHVTCLHTTRHQKTARYCIRQQWCITWLAVEAYLSMVKFVTTMNCGLSAMLTVTTRDNSRPPSADLAWNYTYMWC